MKNIILSLFIITSCNAFANEEVRNFLRLEGKNKYDSRLKDVLYQKVLDICDGKKEVKESKIPNLKYGEFIFKKDVITGNFSHIMMLVGDKKNKLAFSKGGFPGHGTFIENDLSFFYPLGNNHSYYWFKVINKKCHIRIVTIKNNKVSLDAVFK